jgi:hypothetical protein
MNDKAESFELTAPVDSLPVVNDPMQMLGAALDRGMSVADLGPLMDLVERDQANKARVAFMAAMADFQAVCPTIKKTKRADRYVYAPLDQVLRTIRPHLESNGLSIRFDTEMTDNSIITAICTVSHRNGHSEVSHFAAPIDSEMRVNDTQKVGSANSYARRYALMNALNLVASNEDDDGFTADLPPQSEKRKAEIAAREPQAPITSEQIAQLKLHAERLRKEVEDGKPVKRILNQVVFYVDNTAKLTKRDTADILARLDSEAE